MGSFSIWHWLIVLAVVVLVFGTKKLRNMGGDLGAAVSSFKKGMREGEAKDQAQESLNAQPSDKAAAAHQAERKKEEV